MELIVKDNNLILSEAEDFCLEHIFDCGQCFRWDLVDDNTYIGIAKGKALKIRQTENNIIFYNISLDDFNNIWKDYFDISRNYSDIKNELSKDAVLKNAVEYGSGIRILRQDAWECIISFIISASNHIPRIKKIIALLCENFGSKITYMDKEYYTFPTPEIISKLTPDDLSVIRAGFRDKYILAAAKMVTSGEIDIYNTDSLDTAELKKLLMKIPGVGNKVSDCILLFAYARYDSFPIDVWLKRIMEYYYFENKQKIDDIHTFSAEKFGSLGGFAQQYLFFYGRDNKIGI